MIEVKIGTSGYSYPGPPPKGWFGAFYPRTGGRRFDALEYYAAYFDAVEINTTFYRPTEPDMSRAWAAKTPAGFAFAVKVWQKFTHPKKIGEGADKGAQGWEQPTHADIEVFLNGIEPLKSAGKLGVLLFQYPPSFHFTEDNGERLRWTLSAFADYPKVVELRHRSWSDRAAETEKVLGETGASGALIDEPKFESSIRQEFKSAGPIFYLRLHGRNREKWWRHDEPWERYDYLYSREEIAAVARELKALAGCGTARATKAFIFFNNHARGQAVANAIMLRYEMGMPVTARPADSMTRQFPDLAAMVPGPREQSLF